MVNNYLMNLQNNLIYYFHWEQLACLPAFVIIRGPSLFIELHSAP